jgi:hypothetical protein
MVAFVIGYHTARYLAGLLGGFAWALFLSVNVRLPHLVGGVGMIGVTALIALSGARERPAAAEPARVRPSIWLTGLAVLAVPDAGYVIGMATSSFQGSVSALGRTGATGFLGTPVIVALVASLAAAAVSRGKVAPLGLYAGGLLVLVPALVLSAVSDRSSPAGWLIMMGIMKVGEVAVASVPVAYLMTAARGRAVTLVVAGWYLLQSFLSWLGSVPFATISPAQALWTCALLCAGSGLVIFANMRSLRRRYFDRPDERLPRKAGSRRRRAR